MEAIKLWLSENKEEILLEIAPKDLPAKTEKGDYVKIPRLDQLPLFQYAVMQTSVEEQDLLKGG